ncbi:SDR family NAD(P)-dependent oxidoreductase [Enterococcus pallens]|uniref:Short chain dehydrogenase/reductase family oxidoreductase n=1 Tax=Enterococcus pallens ATCC BAA-351 TaxID=1158607 RepID=R2T2L4_9ENTE|nr:SDR family oxidoreductase [Enterococcus pallens]EOH94454.1 hypothetical protein UAU_02189 [Enterococcus pallens ATCC BAA-351]EOU24333.1 hypothetical protein I588_00320 [Enterococcus pallens ATCC BAA-351]
MQNVLITGGTSGIGYNLAKEFARRGFDLILVSSNQENLSTAQQQLATSFNCKVITIQQDLSQIGSAKRLVKVLKENKLKVNILINNAGFGLVDRTEQIDYLEDEKLMILNTISLVQLCKLLLPEMYQNKSGKILNVASTGAFQPGPYTSTYFASKAFVLSYSKAIRIEARKRGVQVCTLCPGPTRTNFFFRERTETPSNSMSAEAVAQIAVQGLMKNKNVIVPGKLNRIMQLATEAIKTKFVANMKRNEVIKRSTE